MGRRTRLRLGAVAVAAAGAGGIGSTRPASPAGNAAAYSAPAFGGAAYAAPVAPVMAREQEVEMLKGQAAHFENALEGIKQRIEELERIAKES